MLTLRDAFVRNWPGEVHATDSACQGSAARPPARSIFCKVRFCAEPNVHVTVREASGFVTTIGASERARGTAATRRRRTKAPRNSGTAAVLGFALVPCVSMGIPIASLVPPESMYVHPERRTPLRGAQPYGRAYLMISKNLF